MDNPKKPVDEQRILELLKSASAEDRLAGIELVKEGGSAGDVRVASALVACLLEDSDLEVRRQADMFAMWDVVAKHAVEAATGKLSGDAESQTAVNCLTLLTTAAELGASSVGVVRKWTSHRDPQIRCQALTAIAAMGCEEEWVAPLFASALASVDTRRTAIFLLPRLPRTGRGFAPQLLNILRNADRRSKQEAMQALDELDIISPEAQAVAREVFRRAQSSSYLITAFLRVFDRERFSFYFAATAGKYLAQYDEDADDVLAWAVEFCDKGFFGEFTEVEELFVRFRNCSRKAVRLLLPLLRGRPDTQCAAMAALCAFKADAAPAVTALIKLLGSTESGIDYPVAAAAEGAIAEIGFAAVPALNAALRDPSERRREFAARALARIRGDAD